ncbi:MAG: hypothetical protein JWQ43_1947 [Glaciihabitans sp.]|nr:hypothetical protein [Glaciihabitans sp.]
MAIVLLFLAVLLGLMALGWHARKRRQKAIGRPAAVPTDTGPDHGTFDGFYVATTVAGDPLNRIAVGGLGFRSRATITVTGAGLILALRGEDEMFIPVSALRGVTRATWTIDRVVEEGGLVLVAWNLGEAETSTAVDTYLRLVESPALLDAINLIFPVSTGRTA